MINIIEKLAELCRENDVGFHIQFDVAEGLWWGWISSAAPEEEKEFRKFGDFSSLVKAMFDFLLNGGSEK